MYRFQKLLNGELCVRGDARFVYPGEKIYLCDPLFGNWQVKLGKLRQANIPTTSGLVNIASIAWKERTP